MKDYFHPYEDYSCTTVYLLWELVGKMVMQKGLYSTDLLMFPRYILSEPVQSAEGSFIGQAFDYNGVKYFDSEMVQHLYNRIDRLSAPAIGTDHRSKPCLGSEQVGEISSVDDLRVGAEQNGGRCDNNSCCIDKRHGKFPDIGP